MKTIQISLIILILFTCLIKPKTVYPQTTRVSAAYNLNIVSKYLSTSPLGIRLSVHYLPLKEIKLISSFGANIHDFKMLSAEGGLLIPFEQSITYKYSSALPIYFGGGVGYYFMLISYIDSKYGSSSVNTNFGYHFIFGYDKYDEGFFIEVRFFNVITNLKEVNENYDIETGFNRIETSKRININSFSITLGFYL